ncbi:MAG TPA: DUF6494 family protein [Methylotenera sp.]|nr:DUF6494 family protein [Methylotenera sp.]
MNNENFNMSIRSFLKMVGVGSQREIEHAVAKAIAKGHLKGNEKLPVNVMLTISDAELNVSFDGIIELD